MKRNKVIAKRNVVAVNKDGLALEKIYVVANKTAAIRREEKVKRIILVDNHLSNDEDCL